MKTKKPEKDNKINSLLYRIMIKNHTISEN